MEADTIIKPSFKYSLLMLISAIAIISVGLLVFGAPIQILMFISMLVMIPFMMRLGFSYKQVEKSMMKSMARALQPGLILLTVGILIGAWIASGTVPTLIYYGIEAVSPQYFLVTTLVFCSLVSMSTGTSWGTIGTAGIAMMGVGTSLGIPAPITAGAIISGAYFGDKISPLSDSTNLAPAVTGGELFTHIKHMLWTTVPAYIITAIIFTVMGLQYNASTVDATSVSALTTYLSETFNLGIVSLIPIVVLITLLVWKKPPIPSIFIASAVGGIVAVAYQGFGFAETLTIFYEGYSVTTGIEVVDSLLVRGGLASMLGLIALFIFALGLGGMLAESGALEALLASFVYKIQHTGLLVFVTILVSYFTLAIGGAIYFSTVMGGTLMRPVFEKLNLKPENLSRILEDTGTQGGALVPWTGSGMYTAATLGVATGAYLPFCFLALITPLVSLFYGITGLTMTKYDESERKDKDRKSNKPRPVEA
ncbi:MULTISPECIES: Na+/H+ antiporter NhaC [Sutcliffiella]|uniref:Na+/H+ antiporter NhaC n=1 Tax=Sutcliffiella cohnii TaxID=33932 RepID=A0A223KVL6_9BACI|nr:MULTISPECIES: Na+/H+ antiporter NhaC [Sutcliffiella]AST93522.1 Na+/H+ antiporter NhaC [Sutcliffiella cohnii]MED4014601.1 Na+/H+ antiporter NhaC [Sutcliffiella cohnii]WBL14706.1 Na+/H+ antiporter NhaC [Sutcliffiella sp. NC1]